MLESKLALFGKDINCVDDNGKTPLFIACQRGQYEQIKELLNHPSIDICREDNSGMSPLDYARKMKFVACAALIKKEAFRRFTEPNHPFLKNLHAKLNTTEGSDFDEELFRQAVENDPEAAQRYLDQFVEINDAEFQFKQVDQIFGLKAVRTSALASILNDCILPVQADKKLDCLQHVVLRRILDIKWELFGARKYYQQLLIYIVMLMAIINLIFSHQNQRQYFTDKVLYKGIDSTICWFVFMLVFCLSGLYYLRYLEPFRMLKLAHWIYDGQYVFDQDDVVPEISFFKARARSWLFKRTLMWALFITVPLMVLVKFFLSSDIKLYIIIHRFLATSCVLWLCTFYFLIVEARELLAHDPWIFYRREKASWIGKIGWTLVLVILPVATPFMASYRKYYTPFINKFQLVTYYVILGPFSFVTCWAGYFQAKQMDVPSLFGYDTYSILFPLGSICTVSLWTLSLQFLEVNKTACYLLPIVADVLADIQNSLILYGVFQMGLTCAFYFIFQSQFPAYKTLWSSFSSTYFVLFGENGSRGIIEILANVNGTLSKDKEPMFNMGLVLRMFQCAVLGILLLNLLLAIMNKTVDRNWEKLQSRALASYARAVLRIEMVLGCTELDRAKLVNLTLSDGKIVLNPIFTEKILRQELSNIFAASHAVSGQRELLEKKIADLTKQNTDLQAQVDQLNESVRSQMQTLRLAVRKRLAKSV